MIEKSLGGQLWLKDRVGEIRLGDDSLEGVEYKNPGHV